MSCNQLGELDVARLLGYCRAWRHSVPPVKNKDNMLSWTGIMIRFLKYWQKGNSFFGHSTLVISLSSSRNELWLLKYARQKVQMIKRWSRKRSDIKKIYPTITGADIHKTRYRTDVLDFYKRYRSVTGHYHVYEIGVPDIVLQHEKCIGHSVKVPGKCRLSGMDISPWGERYEDYLCQELIQVQAILTEQPGLP